MYVVHLIFVLDSADLHKPIFFPLPCIAEQKNVNLTQSQICYLPTEQKLMFIQAVYEGYQYV